MVCFVRIGTGERIGKKGPQEVKSYQKVSLSQLAGGSGGSELAVIQKNRIIPTYVLTGIKLSKKRGHATGNTTIWNRSRHIFCVDTDGTNGTIDTNDTKSRHRRHKRHGTIGTNLNTQTAPTSNGTNGTNLYTNGTTLYVCCSST